MVTPRDVANASGVEHTEPGSGEVARVVGQTLKVVLAQTVVIALAALALFLCSARARCRSYAARSG